MPKFTITFRRTYEIIEGFERVFDAPDAASAEAMASDLLAEFDDNCPDDCSEVTGNGCGDFYLDETWPAADDAIADYPEED